MELRHLRYFVAVAEERHFGRAAERLNMAQPPLSQQIRKLEHELGAALFRRDRRPIDLTEAGKVFLEEARLTLAQADRAMESARRATRGLIGRITVGTVASATYDVLQRVLHAYRERFPDVRLTVRELSSPEQLIALEQRQIHIGFLRPPVTGEKLRVAIVAREPFVIALPADHRLARKKRVSLRALERESLVLFPRREAPGFRDQIIDICRASGFEPSLVQEANQTDTMISLVAAGLGVTLMPASIQRLNLAGVVYRPIAEQTPPAELYAAWRTDEASTALLALTEVIRGLACRNVGGT
ncbi:LysR family transcriptional regulator [bacterium]|nr:MAG: LysR family transcriptional regulator [bacterium]